MSDFDTLVFCLFVVFLPAVFALWAGWMMDKNLNNPNR